MRRCSTAAIVVALLLAACGGDATPFASATVPGTTAPATTTTTTTAPTTTGGDTTTTTGGTTTTRAPFPFAVGTPSMYPPDPLPDGGGANGSGCPPETGPLPDGIWFGKLLEVAPKSADFDPGCFYFGKAAQEQAAIDGITDLPSPHYLRNPLPDLLLLGVADGALAYSIDNSVDPLGFLTLSLDDWPAQNGGYTICPGEGCAVWLYVNGGLVTEILEQYLP